MQLKLTLKLVGFILVAAAVVALVFGGPALVTSLFSAKKEARIAKGQSKAAIDSGAEAGNTVSNVIAADAAIANTVQEGTHEIEQAEAGNSNAAAERAACGMRSYRDSKRCAALREAGAAGAAGGDAAGRPAGKRQAH